MNSGFMLPFRGLLARPDNLSNIAKFLTEFGHDFIMSRDHIVMPQNRSFPIPLL